MINVSNDYKKAMSEYRRERAFISVGIGIINQDAQENGKANGQFEYWSKGNVFNATQSRVEYATLEENYNKADGSKLFVPENNELMQLNYNGIVTSDVMGIVRIDFAEVYSIKGITLVFGSAYPTEFEIETSEKLLTYTNASDTFFTLDVLGDTDYIIIRPLSMVGGQQRFRLHSVLMGVGLSYSNNQTKSFKHKDYVSTISEELPSENTSFTFYDEKGLFDVDDDNSFIDYLETMQKVTISFGITLNDGRVEWHQIATNYLKSWKSQKGIVSLTATDRLSQMDGEYSLGYKIYQRTAYEEAESIFLDAGLQPDEYFIDDYLHDVILTNPMPIGKHKECLQLLANACRCIIRQNENGRILIKANFATVLDPNDLTVTTNGHTKWSKPGSILVGSEVVYAELNKDFLKANGKMYFLPENETYLDTGYVSEQVADETGVFETNPTIMIQMPAAYTYFGVNVNFDGNAPSEMIIHTYKADSLVESVTFKNLSQNNSLMHEFVSFDTMVFEFTKGYPLNRVLVNKISFGELSDYVLTRRNMMENPIGLKERKTKAVKVKVFSFVNNKDNEPEEVKDNVFVEKAVHAVGDVKVLKNPLISTTEHAELLAEWLGNYYGNNISYSVKYRGEPRIYASDIIHMESEVKSNLQVEITEHELSFNGAFSGNLDMRRALKMMGG